MGGSGSKKKLSEKSDQKDKDNISQNIVKERYNPTHVKPITENEIIELNSYEQSLCKIIQRKKSCLDFFVK